ncbi:MAG: hypothetical protein AB2L11_04290 [Syntrophobacteraceae bacterium]
MQRSQIAADKPIVFVLVMTGATRYGLKLPAVPAMRRDGVLISVEFSLVLLRNSAAEIIGSAAVVRDVTVRREREKALKERLAKVEGISALLDSKKPK